MPLLEAILGIIPTLFVKKLPNFRYFRLFKAIIVVK